MRLLTIAIIVGSQLLQHHDGKNDSCGFVTLFGGALGQAVTVLAILMLVAAAVWSRRVKRMSRCQRTFALLPLLYGVISLYGLCAFILIMNGHSPCGQTSYMVTH